MCSEEDRSKWSADKKLEWLVERLKDKINEYNHYTFNGHYYQEGDEEREEGKSQAFDIAADDLKWLLLPLGLMD